MKIEAKKNWLSARPVQLGIIFLFVCTLLIFLIPNFYIGYERANKFRPFIYEGFAQELLVEKQKIMNETNRSQVSFEELNDIQEMIQASIIGKSEIFVESNKLTVREPKFNATVVYEWVQKDPHQIKYTIHINGEKKEYFKSFDIDKT